MLAGQPDRDSAPERGSLAAWLAALLRDGAGQPRELIAAIAILTALGPLATIAGARILIAHERTQAARLQTELQPRLAAAQAAEVARAELAAALARPAMGMTLEALARVLPTDATVMRAERTPQGALDLEVATTDPDRLRAALRRDPVLGGLRDASQRQADTAIIVSLHQDAQ